MFAARNMMFAGVSPILDDDASAYITAVQAAGVDNSHLSTLGFNSWSVIEPIIHEKVIEWKDANVWTPVRRIWLSIWGIEAANEIDMKATAVGDFKNSPTHGAGYVTGNGSNTAFTSDENSNAVGWTKSNAMMGSLDYGTPIQSAIFGNRDQNASDFYLFRTGANSITRMDVPTGTADVTEAASLMRGINVLSLDPSTHTYYQRTSSGGSVRKTKAGDASSTAFNQTMKIAFMCYQHWLSVGSWSNPTNHGQGAFFHGDTLDTYPSTTNIDAFTLTLKELWEGITGLSLP